MEPAQAGQGRGPLDQGNRALASKRRGPRRHGPFCGACWRRLVDITAGRSCDGSKPSGKHNATARCPARRLARPDTDGQVWEKYGPAGIRTRAEPCEHGLQCRRRGSRASDDLVGGLPVCHWRGRGEEDRPTSDEIARQPDRRAAAASLAARHRHLNSRTCVRGCDHHALTFRFSACSPRLRAWPVPQWPGRTLVASALWRSVPTLTLAPTTKFVDARASRQGNIAAASRRTHALRPAPRYRGDG